VTLAALALVAFVAGAWPAAAGKRIAFVVGKSAYKNVAPLDSPTMDAAMTAETLSGLGFALVGDRAQLDLDKSAMDMAVQNFGRQVQGADVALFYHAGHGVQVAGSAISSRSTPIRRCEADAISRWPTSIWCCGRCSVRARGETS